MIWVPDEFLDKITKTQWKKINDKLDLKFKHLLQLNTNKTIKYMLKLGDNIVKCDKRSKSRIHRNTSEIFRKSIIRMKPTKF